MLAVYELCTMRDFFIRNLWRWAAGLPELKLPEVQRRPDLTLLSKTEWSPEFEKLMRNRLLMGAYRYGLLRASGKPQYDRIRSAKDRLDAYISTGNLEHLVDVANMMLPEFVEGKHPLRHFTASDDGPLHAEVKK